VSKDPRPSNPRGCSESCMVRIGIEESVVLGANRIESSPSNSQYSHPNRIGRKKYHAVFLHSPLDCLCGDDSATPSSTISGERRNCFCCFLKYYLRFQHRRQSLPLRCMLLKSHIVQSQAGRERFASVFQHLSRKSTNSHHYLPYQTVSQTLPQTLGRRHIP
jgi:hypothetical protein